MVKYLHLTNGYQTLVDDADYDELSRHAWFGQFSGFRKLYAVRNAPKGVKPATIAMHRHLLGILYSGRSVKGDHINGDTLDNRRENLRVANNKQNQENRVARHVSSTTGIRGVSYYPARDRYMVFIMHNYKSIYLGSFKTLEEAAQASEAGRAKYFTHSSR